MPTACLATPACPHRRWWPVQLRTVDWQLLPVSFAFGCSVPASEGWPSRHLRSFCDHSLLPEPSLPEFLWDSVPQEPPRGLCVNGEGSNLREHGVGGRPPHGCLRPLCPQPSKRRSQVKPGAPATGGVPSLLPAPPCPSAHCLKLQQDPKHTGDPPHTVPRQLSCPLFMRVCEKA